MIRDLLHSVRQRVATSQNQDTPNRFHSEALQVEPLEERILLAFIGFFDGITLDLVQTVDDGDVIVDNSGLGGAFRTIDNADTLTFVDAENVTVTMLDNTSNTLNLNIDTSHTGDVELYLGEGPREVFLSGALNVIEGDLLVDGGDGDQSINLSPIETAPLETEGSATFDLSTGFDTVYNNENFVTIGTDLDLLGVNLFQYTDMGDPVLDAELKVGGDLTMDTSMESVESFLLEGGTFHDPDPAVNARSIISGDFVYIGGDDSDHVDFNETYVVGNLIIDLGDGPSAGIAQNFTALPTAQFDGDVDITAGDSNPGNEINVDGTLNGNVEITVGDSNVVNAVNLNGVFTGLSVTLNLSGTADEVVYSLLGDQADVRAFMGAGDDIFTLNVGINFLNIDFGNDAGDDFINNVGQFNFDVDLTNFHWFDHIYTSVDDTLEMTQLMDTGDITIDNDGGPGAFGISWRLFTGLGGIASTTPAQELILNMLSNTGNNVEMDLFNPVIAGITMNLGDGDRNVDFTGASNNPLRDIVIDAGLGVQNIELAVNASLAVATLDIRLGAGFDTVDDDGNDVVISEDLIFTGVNQFQVDGLLSVTSDASIDVSGEAEDSVFANNANLIIGDGFDYIGGGGSDEVRLNSAAGTSIGGDVFIDLGTNNGAGAQSALLDNSLTSVGGSVTILSTGASGSDLFAADAGTTIGGNIDIDMGEGTNDATIVGIFGGSSIGYDGGGGVDTVTVGTTGTPANINIDLAGGDDTFSLLVGSSISQLLVDFGGGVDTFNNSYGPFDFNAQLLNLNGFSHNYVFATDSLTSTQVAAAASITVDNNGPSTAVQFIDGGTTLLTPVTNLTINMMSSSGTDLNIDLDNSLAGNLTLNLGDGVRELNLTGTDNSIGGDLSVTSGSDEQTVEIAVNNALSVAGSASFDLGLGNDVVDEDGNDISIIADVVFFGVNRFENNGTMAVGGNVVYGTTTDDNPGEYDNDAVMNIAGNFTYAGNNLQDTVNTNADFNLTGNYFAHTAQGVSNFNINNPNVDIGGTITLIATSTTDTDDLDMAAGLTIGGDINVDFGDGPNNADFFGIFGGTNVEYRGGSGADTVIFGLTGNPVDVDLDLETGDDTFTLAAGSSVSSLFVDFGGGGDTFNNLYGAFDFNAQLLNLNGFDHVFDLANTTLLSTQVAASGPVTVDNNGPSNAIRFIDGGTSILGAVTNLTVNMLSGSGTDLNVALDNAFAGDLTLNLGNGTRALNLTGADNSIGGNLNVTGGGDIQTVELAVNNGLTVGGSASFDLGLGNDSVDEDGNDITIAGDLDFVGVNSFENNGTLTAGGNVTVDNSNETEDSLFDDDTTMTIAGNFTYTGGNGRDEVTLNGTSGTSINGDVVIDLGDNISGGTQSVLFNVPASAVGGTLTVTSTSATNLDTFLADAGATFGGDIDIDLGGGVNEATIVGVFGGASVNYDGGSGVDNVTFGTTGNPAALTIRTLADDDTLSLLAGASIASALIDLGLGHDTVEEGGNDVAVGGDLDFIGVNSFENTGTMTVGGNVNVDNSGETEDSLFDDDATMNITGSFTYAGGNGRDEVTLNGAAGGTSIGGDVSIDLGNNTVGGTQFAWLNAATSSVGGTLTIISTSAATADDFRAASSATLGGDINIDLGGGANVATIVGVFGGSTVNYVGRGGDDSVTFGTTGSLADVNIALGAGADTFTLQAGSDVSSLLVDFGGGADTFTNLYGALDFNAQLLNLKGFSHDYEFPTSTLTSTQVSASGPITVDNNGPSEAIQFINGASVLLGPVSDLSVNMLSGSGTELNVALDNALAGDLGLNLGNGTRALNLIGADNSIGGNLSVTGGNDSQTVEVAVNNSLSVGGSALFDLGAGTDVVDEDGNDISIANNLDFVGVNFFENNGTMIVGGNVTVAANEIAASVFDDDHTMTIAGHFTYIGGSGRDEVTLNGVAGGTSIGGDALIDVRNNLFSGTQVILLGEFASVGQSLTVESSAAFNPDVFAAHANTVVGGSIDINLVGGPNDATIMGVLGGSSVKYNGGAGIDNVVFGTTGNPADVNIKLDGGADTFTLEAGAAIAPTRLRVDFGGGNDDFVNNFGAFTFNASLVNWNGYNRFYDHGTSSLNMTQLADTGDITIDNNGVGGAIRLLNGFVTEMTPADNVRLTLLHNSSTDVSVDYDSAQAGNTILSLKKGSRDVMFVGDSNQIGGFLRIEAGTDGVQNVHLAVNADLVVNESVVINLRNGLDTVDDGAHDIIVGNNMILRAVNRFEINNTLNTGGNLKINTRFDNETSILDNRGDVTLGGNLTYLGGTSADNVLMTNATILGNVNVELGNGSTQTADFSGAAVGRLRIVGGDTIGGNHVLTDAGTTVAGDVAVVFGNTPTINRATLLGNYGGTYGTFRGGSGRDNVVFGAIAPDMNFVSRLGVGNDIFTLRASTDLLQSLLDFGLGNDSFVDEIGQPYPFPLTILNLP